MLHDRPVIPRSLHNNVLEHLHAGHASATAMFERAATSLYWPNLRADMINYRAACSTCTKYAPSNPAMPPTEPEQPTYPFQSVCADFFHLSPHNYLVIVDRYSNWLSIFKLPRDDSAEVVKIFRDYITTVGIPCTLTTDGASVFTSQMMEEFCERWGIVHRVATAYHPRANKRAEVGVKSAKRLIRGNTSQTGTLNTDKLARALLAHRNTPCPVTGLSPAQIVFGRVLRDFLPLQPGKFQPRQEWRQAAEARAKAYSKRHVQKAEQLSRGSKALPPLKRGDHVAIQKQTGNNPRQWPNTGVVIEVGPHDSYFVSVDGSRTVTKRNRQYLRKFEPFAPTQHESKAPTSKPSIPITTTTPTTDPYSPVPKNPVPAQIQMGQDEDTPQHDQHQTPEDSPVPPDAKPNPKPLHLREKWIVQKPELVPPIRLQRDSDGNYSVIQPPTNSAMMTPMLPMNPISQVANMFPVPTFPSTVNTVNTPYSYNPVMYQNVANPTMLPNMMMPQQQPYQYSNPSVYSNNY